MENANRLRHDTKVENISTGSPPGWYESTLGFGADYQNGRAFKPTEWESDGLPIIRIQNLNNANAHYNRTTKEHEEKYKVRKGDLLFAWSASLDAFIWRQDDAWLNQHIFNVKPREFVMKHYLFYYLKRIVSEIYSKTHGSGMVHITKSKFEKIEFPIPPLPEQHRIVEKIEELFSEIEKGVESLEKAKAQLGVYRQVVITAAFEGKFIGYSKWRITELGQFADSIRIGPFGTLLHASDYITKGIPVINPKCIANQRIKHDSRVTIPLDKADELKNYELRENDIILGRRGEMGRTAFVSEKEDGWICGTGSMRIRLNIKDSGKLYSLYLSSRKVKRILLSNATGTTMSNLNEKIVKRVPVPIIPPDEQIHLINEIESRLSVCDKVEESIEQGLKQAEMLKQSVLKKAFEGKLVPQNPEDEPASVLLERIRQERENLEKVEKESAPKTKKKTAKGKKS